MTGLILRGNGNGTLETTTMKSAIDSSIVMVYVVSQAVKSVVLIVNDARLVLIIVTLV